MFQILSQEYHNGILRDSSRPVQYNIIIYRSGNILLDEADNLFRGYYFGRGPYPFHTDEKITDMLLVPRTIYNPMLPKHVKMVASSIPEGIVYSKGFSLDDVLAWKPEDDIIASPLGREINVCEVLRKRPWHDNLSGYLGVRETMDGGRVESVCFVRYPHTLNQKVNPCNYDKKTFLTKRTISAAQAEKYLTGIRRGLRHLHKANLIHNNLTPNNIMISADDEAIIIDFESVEVKDMKLLRIKRTSGWHDPEANIAAEENDFAALRELRVWLSGTSPSQYRFDCPSEKGEG